MKCSVTSERGQPTPSPARMGAWPVLFLSAQSKLTNPAHVVGAWKPLALKYDTLYQNPGFTFPV